MNFNISAREKLKLTFSRCIGAFASGILLAMLVLYYLDRINQNVIILSVLGLGAIILGLSTLSFKIKYSKFWAAVTFTLSVILAIAFIGVCMYIYFAR